MAAAALAFGGLFVAASAAIINTQHEAHITMVQGAAPAPIDVQGTSLEVVFPEWGLTIHSGPPGQIEPPCGDAVSELAGAAQVLRLTCADVMNPGGVLGDLTVPSNLPVKIIGGDTVTASGQFASLTLQSGAEVTLNDVSGDVLVETTGPVTGTIGAAKSVQVDTSGRVELGLKRPVPKVAISSSADGVLLTMPSPRPPELTYALDLDATGGRVVNSVPSTPGAAHSVAVTSTGGDIQIRTATTQ